MKKTRMTTLVATFAVAVGLFAQGAAVTAAPAAPAKARAIDRLTYPKLHDIKMPVMIRETLANGLKLILVEDHEVPRISFRATVRGGHIAEPAGKTGLADLLGEVQRTGGTATMKGDDIDQLIERLGATVESGVGEASFLVSGEALTETLDTVLPVFTGVLTAPVFAQDKVDLAKTHMRSGISRRNDQVMGIARRELAKLLYGSDSPYARQIEYDNVEALTREDLIAFHASYFHPDATILAVWGDFKPAEMKAKLTAALGGWKATGPLPAIAQPKLVDPVPSINYIEKKDVEQTFIMMGQLGTRLDDPDYPAINMLSEILGGGFSSRLFVKVRTEKGLAYSAGGGMRPAFDHRGTFFFFTATKPATTAEALGTVLDEIRKIREAEVSDDELARARESYLNSYAFEFDSTAKILDRAVNYQFYGYPADFNTTLRDRIDKVTKADVLRVAKAHLDPANLVILAIGRAEQFDKPLTTFGKVNTLDITIPEPKPKEKVQAATAGTITRGREILAKVAAASGEAMATLRDLTTEGSATVQSQMGQMDLKGTTLFVPPGRLRQEMTTPMGVMVQVLDGDAGFIVMGPQSQDLPGSMLGELKRELLFKAGAVLLLQDVASGKTEAQAVGQAEFEGAKVEDVVVTLGVAPLHLYVDPATSAIVGTRTSKTTPQGPADVVQVFSDFRTDAGLRLPWQTVQKVNGEVKATSKLTSVKVNAGFAETAFAKPAAPAK